MKRGKKLCMKQHFTEHSIPTRNTKPSLFVKSETFNLTALMAGNVFLTEKNKKGRGKFPDFFEKIFQKSIDKYPIV